MQTVPPPPPPPARVRTPGWMWLDVEGCAPYIQPQPLVWNCCMPIFVSSSDDCPLLFCLCLPPFLPSPSLSLLSLCPVRFSRLSLSLPPSASSFWPFHLFLFFFSLSSLSLPLFLSVLSRCFSGGLLLWGGRTCCRYCEENNFTGRWIVRRSGAAWKSVTEFSMTERRKIELLELWILPITLLGSCKATSTLFWRIIFG